MVPPLTFPSGRKLKAAFAFDVSVCVCRSVTVMRAGALTFLVVAGIAFNTLPAAARPLAQVTPHRPSLEDEKAKDPTQASRDQAMPSYATHM